MAPSNRRASNADSSNSHRSEKREQGRDTHGHDERRRGSLKPPEKERPRYASRTSSAPMVPAIQTARGDRSRVTLSPLSPRSDRTIKKKSSEDYFSSRHEVNIAVLGNARVGKSTFIERLFDLSESALEDDSSCTITIAGNRCLVRLFELSIHDVYESEHEALTWPTVLRKFTIHGVMILYDVSNKASFRLVPEALSGSC